MRVKLWIKNSLTYALAGLAGAAVYTLMMFLMEPDFEMGRLMNMASGYLVGIGVVMTVVVGLMDYKTTLPLALSLGSTRKEALIGMQLGRLVYALVFLAAIALLFAAGNGLDSLPVLLPIALGAMLAMSAVGAVFGMVTVKFGKVAAVVVGVLIGLLTAGCVFAGIVFIVADIEINGGAWLLWLVPLFGGAVYGAVLIPEVKSVYHYNVKL